MEFGDLLARFSALGGLAAIVALVVNVLKAVGVVKDGQATTWVTGLNLVGLAALYIIGVVKPAFDVDTLDTVLLAAAQFGSALLELIVSVLGSRVTHYAVRGTPVIGSSHSLIR